MSLRSSGTVASASGTRRNMMPVNGTWLTVFDSRMAKRRKPPKKRRGKGSTDSSRSAYNSVSSEHMEMDNSTLTLEDGESLNSTLVQLDSEGEPSRSRIGSEVLEEGDEVGVDGLLRLPEMTDTSMDSVGQPLRDVMNRLNGSWEHPDDDEEVEKEKNSLGCSESSQPPAQQPFREDSGGKPPDPAPGKISDSTLAQNSTIMQASCTSAESSVFTPNGPDSADTGGGHDDSAEHSQSQTFSGGFENEGKAEAPAGQTSDMREENMQGGESLRTTFTDEEAEQQLPEEKLSPSETSHPAEFK